MVLQKISKVLLIFLICQAGSSSADVTSIIKSMIVDKLQLEIRVQDSQGNSLPGAVIWYIGSPVRLDGRLRVNKKDFERMASRYWDQSDFLHTSDTPGTVFERTNSKGAFFDIGRRYTGDSHYDYILVATKRGYIPQVVDGTAPLNRKHVVLFKLQSDPEAHIDLRMETFDQIMAQARDTSPEQDYMGEARMIKLEQSEQALRQLAQSLEADGLHNEASAVYWALADFPSVTRITTADGQQKITGYANGRTGLAAEADRVKATQLNTTVPKLLINKMMMQEGFPREGIESAEHGLAFLAAFEGWINGPDREKILPSVYEVAIWQAIRWSTPDKSCELLQKAYVFEPVTMPLKDWWARIKDVESQLQRLNLPAGQCIISGLPSNKVLDKKI